MSSVVVYDCTCSCFIRNMQLLFTIYLLLILWLKNIPHTVVVVTAIFVMDNFPPFLIFILCCWYGDNMMVFYLIYYCYIKEVVQSGAAIVTASDMLWCKTFFSQFSSHFFKITNNSFSSFNKRSMAVFVVTIKIHKCYGYIGNSYN